MVFDITQNPLMLLYFVCAVFGGTMLLLQLVLMFFGIGGDVDADGDFDVDGADGGAAHSDTTDIFRLLTLRTIVAGLTFFGLGGLIGLTGGVGQILSVILATICGLIAIVIVYYLYESISRLKSDGSISETTLVGCHGSVYVRIPAVGEGAGKVLVTQQERTMEYEAISSGESLKSGTPIVVVRVVSPTTVEVASVN